jgi:hypothetical protein
LASYSCFPTLPEASLSATHEVQPPAWPSQKLSDLRGPKFDSPPWLSLVFECLWPPLSRSSLRSDYSKNYLIWVDSTRIVPLAYSKVPPECLFRRVTYLGHYA